MHIKFLKSMPKGYSYIWSLIICTIPLFNNFMFVYNWYWQILESFKMLSVPHTLFRATSKFNTKADFQKKNWGGYHNPLTSIWKKILEI